MSYHANLEWRKGLVQLKERQRKWYKMLTFEEIRPEFEISSKVEGVISEAGYEKQVIR